LLRNIRAYRRGKHLKYIEGKIVLDKQKYEIPVFG
jgi:hypothetical protein